MKIGRGPATVIGFRRRQPGYPLKPHRLRTLRERGSIRKWPLKSRGAFLLGTISHNSRQGKFVPRVRCNCGPRAILLVFALLFLCPGKLAAQGNTNANAPKSAAVQPSTHEVMDEVGRTVRIPLVPTRIVSLAPNLTETVYALGLQERLVGDTD